MTKCGMFQKIVLNTICRCRSKCIAYLIKVVINIS